MLVLLNESIDILSPEVAGHRVARLMERARADQSLVPRIDVAWLIFESHVAKINSDQEGFISLRIDNASHDTPSWFDSNFESLQKAWASQNYGALINAEFSDPSNLRSKPSTEEKAKYQ